MTYPSGLPREYRPYPVLRFCGNDLIGVQVPLAMNGLPVLLVGVGPERPSIWVSGPPYPYVTVLTPLVRLNVSQNPDVQVRQRISGRVDVEVGRTLILTVSALGLSHAEVEYIDFTPIGLAVRGERTHLQVGGTVLADNTFQNVHTAFAVSPSV